MQEQDRSDLTWIVNSSAFAVAALLRHHACNSAVRAAAVMLIKSHQRQQAIGDFCSQ